MLTWVLYFESGTGSTFGTFDATIRLLKSIRVHSAAAKTALILITTISKQPTLVLSIVSPLVGRHDLSWTIGGIAGDEVIL